ncbi:MAG: phosphodiester glycosidase family protein [bacterium]
MAIGFSQYSGALSRHLRFLAAGLVLLFLTSPALAAPWWSLEKVEETREVDAGVVYERVLFQRVTNEPVRAHILSVTGNGGLYQFGVLGSFGVLFPPSEFAKHSGAIAVINGGFFSVHPNRALGLVAAHNRVLYPPHAGTQERGAVGFSPTDILIDWISADDIQNNRFQSGKAEWNQCYAALGAGPILIKKGQSRLDTSLEGFNKTQTAPRTAIAKTKDGHVLLVVIDGRQPDWSAGVTLEELTELFLARGVNEALNLDGGGSSVMVVQNQVLSRPSDMALPGFPGKERAVPNVISLFKK